MRLLSECTGRFLFIERHQVENRLSQKGHEGRVGLGSLVQRKPCFMGVMCWANASVHTGCLRREALLGRPGGEVGLTSEVQAHGK